MSNLKKILLIGPGTSLETLNPHTIKTTQTLYFGSSFHWFEKNNVCPTYWTFIDPNTITYFDSLINGISNYDKTHPNRYDYGIYINYLKNTLPYHKDFITKLSQTTTLIYGNLQGSKDFYSNGFTTSRGPGWFEGEYKNDVLPRVESHFKEVKKFPQNICVNDYSSLYNTSLKHLSPIITHEPNINTDKFICYILPLVLSYFKELKEIECVGFGDFNKPRLHNNTMEGYDGYKSSYERMKDQLINLLNFKNISINFKNKDSYFIELENNTKQKKNKIMALDNNQISNNGFWLTTDEEGHCFDQPLCETIKDITKNKSLLDLGCGTGAYTKELQSTCTSAKGYDGNPNTLKISNGLCEVADLTKKQKFDTVDWVLSLEVGEHVPKESEDVLLDNICSHSAKGVILSWAVPGQPGDGHINCQSNEYIVNKMLSKGFAIDWDLSFKLRENATLWWFKNTVMCFKKLPTPKSITSMEKITFCIPSKSNVQYLKTCISSIRKNAYRNDHEIIIFVDSDEDGTVKWLEEVKDKYNLQYYVNPKIGEELYGIGRAYDFCVEKSTTDIFMIFHADMILGKNTDFKAYKYLNEKTVVCATRIEPPLHPNKGEKVLEDFGMYPEDFKEEEFNQHIKLYQPNLTTTEGIFAPWMMYKKEYLEILGGHDPILHSCREDSDVFNRMLLAGFEFVQTWEGFVYHFTGRGAGSFDGDQERHDFWKQQMNNSTRDFIRKWGQNVNHTPMMKPIVHPKYNIGYRVENCHLQLLEALEPWCDRIYVDELFKVIGRSHDYIEMEQENTSFDLSKRIHTLTDNDRYDYDDILVEINGKLFTQQDFQTLQQLPEILQDSGEEGSFELGNLKITISSLETYEKELIVCSSQYVL